MIEMKAWMDNAEIVEVLKTLSNEVDKLRVDLAVLKTELSIVMYKNHDD